MSIVLALLGALVYGASDFSGGLATRRSPAIAVVASSQFVGLLVLIPALLLAPGRFDGPSLAWGVAAGAVGAVSLILFYRTLAIGPMSVVAPIAAVTSAAVPVIAGLIGGERPSVVTLVGVVLALVAVVLVGAEGGRVPTPREMIRARATPGALLAGTGFGLLFVLLSHSAPDSGYWPLASARVASLLLLCVVALVTRQSVLARGAHPGLVIIAGLGDMGANVLFVVAVRMGLLSVTGLLLSLYPAGTVLLALVLLRERLVRIQIVGLAAAVVAVVLVAVG